MCKDKEFNWKIKWGQKAKGQGQSKTKYGQDLVFQAFSMNETVIKNCLK